MHNENSNLSEKHPQAPRPGLSPSGSLHQYSSDDDLSALLQSLPREGASLGFEERVLRRVRAQPKPPLTFGRGLRFAAPLLVAGALGFVFGPGLLERPDSRSSGAGEPQIASAEVVEGGTSEGEAESGSSLVGKRPRSRTIPSVANSAQVVAMPALGMPSSGMPSSGMSGLGAGLDLSRIRADAARVRRQLEELRRTRSAAGPTVNMTLEDGVVVQVDLRELLAALEQQALEARSRRVAESIEKPDNAAPSEGPPLW